jgi:hypothetical protein
MRDFPTCAIFWSHSVTSWKTLIILVSVGLDIFTHLELAEKWSHWVLVFTLCPALRICLVLLELLLLTALPIQSEIFRL